MYVGLAQQINKPDSTNKWNKINEYPSPFFARITKPANSD